MLRKRVVGRISIFVPKCLGPILTLFYAHIGGLRVSAASGDRHRHKFTSWGHRSPANLATRGDVEWDSRVLYTEDDEAELKLDDAQPASALSCVVEGASQVLHAEDDDAN